MPSSLSSLRRNSQNGKEGDGFPGRMIQPPASPFLTAAFVVVAVLFIFGGVRMFQLRFEAGDSYPAYSSLRSDPLGTRALYQSLERIKELKLSRSFSPLSRLPLDEKYTLLLAGLNHRYGLLEDPQWQQSIEHLLGSGSRAVICFYPYQGDTGTSSEQEGQLAKTSPPPDKAPRRPGPGPGDSKEKTGGRSEPWKQGEPLFRRWGFDFDVERLENSSEASQHSTVSLQTSVQAPKTLGWHSQLAFKNLAPEWRVIYRRQHRPVLIERALGSGTLVMASDSYFLSNEALWKDRQPQLLAWLLGSQSRVVFEETHLGLSETPGVMSLMRKYRMHGLLASLLLLAALFIWRNMLSLIPPLAPLEAAGPTGRNATAGFANLLRRNVPASDLLPVCVEQWAKSLSPGSPEWARLSQIQSLVAAETAKPSRTRDPVKCYQQICQVLRRSPNSVTATEGRAGEVVQAPGVRL